MTSLAPKTLNCDLTEECSWDDAETLSTYCFNLEDMDPTIQVASATLGDDWTAAPPFEWVAELCATEPVPPYNLNDDWIMAKIEKDLNNWGKTHNWGLSNDAFEKYVKTGQLMSKLSQEPAKETASEIAQGYFAIRGSQESPCYEGSQSIRDLTTIGELEPRDEQKSPEELDWPEELRPAEIVRNESELIDGEVIKFIGDSCELVAPTEILSDQPKDSYESQKSTSLLNSMYSPTYFIQN